MSKPHMLYTISAFLISVLISASSHGAVLLSDNFDDGNDNGWTQFQGIWSVSAGEYMTGITDDNFYSLNGQASWSNYTFEADVKMGTWENDIGLVFYSR